ncbi:MAG TPA: dephospho-CoA kinase [Steroidobacteraceae bacterium]|nr:dephospho-CoA kinase [Steroidobacteraceae bacterium]
MVAPRALTAMATPLRIGLTGGIASGKSAVEAAFARRAVPVVDTDRLAREVVEPGTPALAAVLAAFGAGLAGPDGRLDRRRLRALVFADEGRRRQLEAILHPAIRAAMNAAVERVASPYVVIAIPLLVESGQRGAVDRVLVVDCPPELQLKRLIARDHETPEGARAMLAAQASREARLAAADDLIDNTGTLEDLDRAVETLHRRYLALAARDGSERR